MATLARGQEIELRACCGKLRWALLDVIEPLPGGTRISGLRWGPELVPFQTISADTWCPETSRLSIVPRASGKALRHSLEAAVAS